MVSNLLILLIGGRLQPVTLFAVSQQPSVIAIIASQDSKSDAENAVRRLPQLLPDTTLLPPLFVHPYRPAQTTQAIQSLLQREDLAHLQPAISLTSAPAPMTIGAYVAAKTHGCPAYYLVTSANEVLDFTRENEIATLPLHVTVEQYLANFGLSIAPKQKPVPHLTIDREEQLALCRFLLEKATFSADVLDWMRSKTHLPNQRLVPGPLSKRWPIRFGQEHWNVLEALEAYSVITNLTRSSQGGTVRFELPDEDSVEYIKGDWLEFYIFEEARAASLDNATLFGEVLRSLRFESEGIQREIDLIGVWRGTALIASCKTGQDTWKKSVLDEIGAVARLLGDSYCTRLLITNRTVPAEGSKDHSAWQTAVQNARNQKVVIVTGDKLYQIAAILRRELLTPTYPRR